MLKPFATKALPAVKLLCVMGMPYKEMELMPSPWSRVVCVYKLGIAVTVQHSTSERVLLQALHALTITEPGLCMPPEDAEKFCRCLAPYLKSSAADRRAAEQLMCILHIEVPPPGLQHEQRHHLAPVCLPLCRKVDFADFVC